VSTHVWPSREEWAKDQRTPYYDHFEGGEGSIISNRLADYADETTIAAAIKALESLWRELGRQMRACQDAEQKEILKDRRAGINCALKTMRAGEIPSEHAECRSVLSSAILAPFDEPRDAALKAAYEQREREIAATPIDDAAWAKELQRRAHVEKWLEGRKP
jgi:hypothetical protein